ncbi:MAG TPA: FAD-dependent oxidoreductase [Clostridia bacterium]
MLTRDTLLTHIANPETTYDVLVAGAGPAGIGAALGAAACGARTAVLEARGYFGGVAAVSHWMPMNRLLLQGESRGGVHGMFVDKIRSFGPDACREGKKSWVDGDGLHIHPEYLRLGVYELFEEAGCAYRLLSPVTGADMDGANIRRAVSATKEGVSAFTANIFIDASGDGDLAFHAGVPMASGRETDGALMPVTLSFALCDVDVDRLYTAIEALGNEQYQDLIRAGEADGFCVAAWYSFDRSTLPGIVSVNNGGWNHAGRIDATKTSELIVADRSGVQVAADFIRIAHERKVPGLENCRLLRVGAAPGVRETRRIVGEYVMTLEDAVKGTEFEDVIARRYGAVDPGGLSEGRDLRTVMKSGHAYPYRSLLPMRVDNLLAAGRCASASHLGLTAGKSMGNMMALGQAAGVAAALAAQKGIRPRDLDAKLIQKRLRDMGVPL